MARIEDFTFVVAVFGGTGAKGSASVVGAAKARAKKTAWMVRRLLTHLGADWSANVLGIMESKFLIIWERHYNYGKAEVGKTLWC